uniref:Uncharacterized protein n=1 Tax=Triticum urartu TaxID=4572 RepID=A0A8R7UJ63_TRIUA
MPAAGQGALDASSSGDASSPARLTIHNVDILTHVPAKLDFDADNYAEWRDGMLSALRVRRRRPRRGTGPVAPRGRRGVDARRRHHRPLDLHHHLRRAAGRGHGRPQHRLRGLGPAARLLRGRRRVRPGPGAPHRRAGGHVRQRLRLAPQGAGPRRRRRGWRARLRHRAGPA